MMGGGGLTWEVGWFGLAGDARVEESNSGEREMAEVQRVVVLLLPTYVHIA